MLYARGVDRISIVDVKCDCNLTAGCEKCRKIVEDYNRQKENGYIDLMNGSYKLI